ncbi:MAG: hypothetical protein WDN25_07475 [Acetobacteraceae bacterium]
MTLWLATAALLIVLTLGYGFGYRFAETSWPLYFGLWSLTLLPIFLAMIASQVPDKNSSRRLAWPAWLAPSAPALMFCVTVYFWLPSSRALPVVIAIITATCALLYSRRYSAALALPLVGNVLLALVLIASSTLQRSEADMLPVIIDANNYLLNGSDPYIQSYGGSYFYYLPLQWLVFFPAAFWNFDPRIENFVFLIAATAVALWLAYRRQISEPALTMLLCLIVSRIGMEMILRGQVWPYWLLILGFGLALLHERFTIATIVAGMLIAAQQPALLIVALFGLYVLVHFGWRKAVFLGAIGLATYLVIMGPWLWHRPALINELYVVVQQRIAADHALQPVYDQREISLLNLLQATGLGWLRSPFQLAFVAAGALAIVARGRRMTTAHLLCVIGTVFVGCISLNVQVFKYYYYPGLFCLALGLSAALPDRSAYRAAQRPPGAGGRMNPGAVARSSLAL